MTHRSPPWCLAPTLGHNYVAKCSYLDKYLSFRHQVLATYLCQQYAVPLLLSLSFVDEYLNPQGIIPLLLLQHQLTIQALTEPHPMKFRDTHIAERKAKLIFSNSPKRSRAQRDIPAMKNITYHQLQQLGAPQHSISRLCRLWPRQCADDPVANSKKKRNMLVRLCGRISHCWY